MMRTKVLFFFLLFIVSFRGFSQENKITLPPDKEVKTTVVLSPFQGNGDAINLPVSLVWDRKESNAIEIQFQGTNASNRFIYFFPKKMSYGEVKKKDKQIWFSSEIQKFSSVDKWIDNPDSLALVNKSADIIESSLSGPAPLRKCMFQFTVLNPEVVYYHILMRVYVASQTKCKALFSKRDRKIEYLSELSLNIVLEDLCESPKVKSNIDSFSVKLANIQTITANVTSETDELPSLTKVALKGRNNKQALGEDEKYVNKEQYGDCEKLKKAINDYNGAIDSYNKAINDYNTKLDYCKSGRGAAKVKAKVVKDSQSSSPCNPDRQSVVTANKQLMDLYYKIDQTVQGGQKDVSSYKSEYTDIKNKVGDCNKIFPEYDAFKEWCGGIDKLLNK